MDFTVRAHDAFSGTSGAKAPAGRVIFAGLNACSTLLTVLCRASTRRQSVLSEPEWCLGVEVVLRHNSAVNFGFVASAFRRLPGRYLALPAIILTCAPLLSEGAKNKAASIPSHNYVSRERAGAGRRSDRDYIPALAAANRFLQAWQNQDRETGLLMLTDAAKQGSTATGVETFFASGADAAYEIARGKRVGNGRFAFPVTLFPFHSGPSKPDRPQKSEIVVVRSGKDEWAIDRLP
jgi:hypothetical protein